MAYTKNTWTDGDIVSSAKLNHMEDGIANAESVFIVGGVSLGEGGTLEGTLDKTWQEIHDAMQSKICIVVITLENTVRQELITKAAEALGSYVVMIAETQFTTDSANGYPAGGGGK